MNIAVVGSRVFNNYEFLKTRLMLHFTDGDKVVSGGARGADRLSERFAKEFNYETIIYKPLWDIHGKRAGYLRNEDIVNKSDLVIAFWDGKSKGTKHTIDLTTKDNKPLIIYTIGRSLEDEWGLGDYIHAPCPNCDRQRLCICANGHTRCGKCNWIVDLDEYCVLTN